MTGVKSVQKSKNAEYVREILTKSTAYAKADGGIERFSYLENMYVDYEGGGDSLESIPGFRSLYSFVGNINGIFEQDTDDGAYILVHAGESLYRFLKSSRSSLSSEKAIATLADAKSHAFAYGNSIYILDGKSVTVLNNAGDVSKFSDSIENDAYVPTLYIDGEPYEDRNILTNRAREVFNIEAAEYITYGTHGLKYEITDIDKKLCKVIGAESDIDSIVNIPTYTMMNNERYKVVSIRNRAFEQNSQIVEVIVGPGVIEIEDFAFSSCPNLIGITMSSSLRRIGAFAFFDCPAMNYAMLGTGVEEIGEGAFADCPELTEISYPYTPNEFQNVKGYDALGELGVIYGEFFNMVTIALKLSSPMESIERLEIDGVKETFTYDAERREVVVVLGNPHNVQGRRIEILGTLSGGDTSLEMGKDIYTIPAFRELGTLELIEGCKYGTEFDGRIFLGGNPSAPGIVFYSATKKNGEISPYYFGARSYLNLGDGGTGARGLFSFGKTLAVLCGGADERDSVLYFGAKSGKEHYDSERYTQSGICRKVGINSLHIVGDVPYIITNDGISKLSPTATGGRIGAELVSSRLARRDTLGAHLTEWCGYLVLLIGCDLYLGDTRGGSGEHEWYHVSGVGSYKNDTNVYRYSESASSGYEVHPSTDERASGIVMSVMSEGGMIFYVEGDGKKYAVYPTEERKGGTLSEPSVIFSDGKLLFFGTGDGTLCLFNNDMRGIAPKAIATMRDFDDEEYAAVMGDRIHPYYYSFMGHAPTYAVRTERDDLGLPYAEKTTVPRSLGIMIRGMGTGKVFVKIGTDRGGESDGCEIHTSPLGFGTVDFSAFGVNGSDFELHVIDEPRRPFVDKDILIYTDEYASPFAIRSINYRYKIKGKIKRNAAYSLL